MLGPAAMLATVAAMAALPALVTGMRPMFALPPSEEPAGPVATPSAADAVEVGSVHVHEFANSQNGTASNDSQILKNSSLRKDQAVSSQNYSQAQASLGKGEADSQNGTASNDSQILENSSRKDEEVSSQNHSQAKDKAASHNGTSSNHSRVRGRASQRKGKADSQNGTASNDSQILQNSSLWKGARPPSSTAAPSRRIQYLYAHKAGLADRVSLFTFLNHLAFFHNASAHIPGGLYGARLFLDPVHSASIAKNWSFYLNTTVNNGNPFHATNSSLRCRNITDPQTDWSRIFDDGGHCVNIVLNFYGYNRTLTGLFHGAHKPPLSNNVQNTAKHALKGVSGKFGVLHIRRCDRVALNLRCTDPDYVKSLVNTSNLTTWLVFTYAEIGYLTALQTRLAEVASHRFLYEDDILSGIEPRDDNYLRYAAATVLQSRASEFIELRKCAAAPTAPSLESLPDTWVDVTDLETALWRRGVCNGRYANGPFTPPEERRSFRNRNARFKGGVQLQGENGGTTHLLSFRSCSQDPAASCNHQLLKSLRDLSEAAMKIPSIDQQHLYQGLPPELEDGPRWSRHVAEGLRGRGYWFWKPALLNLLWRNGTFQDGDVVIWADADDEAHYFRDNRAAELWSSVLPTSQEWDFLVHSQQFCEAQYTKGDIFELFGVPWHDRHYGMTPQVHADYWVVHLNERTRELMRMWEDLVSDFHLVSDEESTAPDPPYLRESRHDQSLLSMLIKANVPQMEEGAGECQRFLREIPPSDAPGRPWLRHETYGIEGLTVKVGDLWKDTPVSSLSETPLPEPETRQLRRLCIRGACTDLDESAGPP